jgi:hypothetical protein
MWSVSCEHAKKDLSINGDLLLEHVPKKNPFVIWLPTAARSGHLAKLIQKISFLMKCFSGKKKKKQ